MKTSITNLGSHAQRIKQHLLAQLAQLSSQQQHRGLLCAAGLTLDYTRHWVDEAAWAALLDALATTDCQQRQLGLWNGALLNCTEQRPATHVLWRDPAAAQHVPAVCSVIKRSHACAEAIVQRVRQQKWLHPIKHIVHIGVGGSLLGPQMLCQALSAWHNATHGTHWCDSADLSAIRVLLRRCDPKQTMFIVATKSMSTTEVLSQYEVAREWLSAAGEDPRAHTVVVTAAPDRARPYVLSSEQICVIDWGLGGRYSVWSPISLAVMCAVGLSVFTEFKQGARTMDQHFRTAAWRHNMPVLMACLTIWYQQLFSAQSHCLVAYDAGLMAFSNYVQQLSMESNGKSVDVHGHPITHASAPITWGGAGTSGQHSYFQLLYQGSHFVPLDVVVADSAAYDQANDRKKLLMQAYAQVDALMHGNDRPAHRLIAGGCPSSLIKLKQYGPAGLGALCALYEHKTLVESAWWQTNPFDQFGVELGKQYFKKYMQQPEKNHQ